MKTRSNLLLMAVILVPISIILGTGLFLFTPGGGSLQSGKNDINAVYAALDTTAIDKATAKIHGGDVDDMVQRLEKRLAASPNDADGWRVLGWSHYRRQNFSKSVEAYRRAAELDTKTAILKSLHGEALVATARGRVTPDAIKAFKAALSQDPGEVRANFFLGQAKLQDNEPKSAIDIWIALLKNAPKNANWARDLRTRIAEVARDAGIDVSQSLHQVAQPKSHSDQPYSRRAGPTAADIENAQKLSPDARQAMARDMVERLAKRLEESPGDPDGWIMLMRSRMVLKQPEKAKAAMKKALKTFTQQPDVKQRITQAGEALFQGSSTSDN